MVAIASALRGLRARPALLPFLVTFGLLSTYEWVHRRLSPDLYVQVGPDDGTGPFRPVRRPDGGVEAGEPLAGVEPGAAFAMVGDLRLDDGVREDAVIAFTCLGRTYYTIPRMFPPGTRPRGRSAGLVQAPPDAPRGAECEVTREMALTTWYGLSIPKRLRSVRVRILP